MTTITTKTNVRRHDRHLPSKVADVRRHERKVTRQVLGTIPIRDIRYNQARRILPGFSANGDIDGDGVKNKKDCRPFDAMRQDDDEDEYDKDFVRRDKELLWDLFGDKQEKPKELLDELPERQDFLKREQTRKINEMTAEREESLSKFAQERIASGELPAMFYDLRAQDWINASMKDVKEYKEQEKEFNKARRKNMGEEEYQKDKRQEKYNREIEKNSQELINEI